MIQFSRNNLSSSTQPWARFHEDEIRVLNDSIDIAENRTDAENRSMHAVIDNLNAKVFELGGRKAYLDNQVFPVSLGANNSSWVSTSISSTFTITSSARDAIYVLQLGPVTEATPTGDDVVIYADLFINGSKVASKNVSSFQMGTGYTINSPITQRQALVGYAQVLGNGVTNTVSATFNAYKFSAGTKTVSFNASFLAQVK